MSWADVMRTNAPGWTILVRLLVGLVVFFPEGLQKLIFPDLLGAGRFARIGIPFPDLMGPFVGIAETVCGAFIIVGLFTRLAAIPLIIIMLPRLHETAHLAWTRCRHLPPICGHQAPRFLEHDA